MKKAVGGKTRVDLAVDQIIQVILDRDMKAGDKLPNEYDLARELGVGRSTLREAIKRLVARNILTARQGAGMFIYRELKWSDLFDIFVDSAKSSAMTLFIIATSTAFAWLFAYAGISTQLVDFVVGMHLSATMYCLVVAVILLIFGTFLEGIATAVLLVPVLWPVAQALGVNVIHFGMIVSIANVVGTMTPPVAVNIFSAASVTKLSMGKIVHGQWPFFIGYVGFFFLVVFIPALSTFLL